jgi:GNAT superfamily N-acetyltransferase
MEHQGDSGAVHSTSISKLMHPTPRAIIPTPTMQPDHAPHAYAPRQWTIEPLAPSDLPAVTEFNQAARGELFPELARNPDPSLTNSDAVFMVARAAPSAPGTPTSETPSSTSSSPADADAGTDAEAPRGDIVGLIGFIPFNPRFPELPALPASTAEVVRLYVSRPYRQCGLARALFGALKKRARELGCECFYLHTHQFLPGAVTFWGKVGFEVMRVEDEGWQLVHMRMRLGTEDKEVGVVTEEEVKEEEEA